MQAFEKVTGIALPIDRENVDTDAIVPQRWLVTVERDGLGAGLFGSLRYDENGHDRADFVLNQPAYQGAKIIVAGANYGCGSSREHAVWAHLDYGIHAIIAPSYGPIFYENCLKNGLLPVLLPEEAVRRMLRQIHQAPGTHLGVDLAKNQVTGPDGVLHGFSMDEGRRKALLEGTDDIALTLKFSEQIAAFAQRDAQDRPWTA